MLRLRQIALVAHDLDPVVSALRDVFALGEPFNDPGVDTFGLRNAVLPAGHQFVEVVAPSREGTAGGRYLERRNGDGGYMVILQCDDHPAVKARVDALGIRKVVEHDGREYCIMQLHPRDTGGSFLEIDVQHGGEPMDGPWEPAGPTWQANRTDVLVAVTAAEIQADDPAALAARWGQILDRAVETTDDGAHALALDNATLRFVPSTDGRGEGLGGIDVTVRAEDLDGVLARAADAGLTSDGDPALVGAGGMRIAVRAAAG
jgi:hypothetical protein